MQFLLKKAVLRPITKEPLPAQSPTSYFLLQSGFPRVCLHNPLLMHPNSSISIDAFLGISDLALKYSGSSCYLNMGFLASL